MRHGHGLRKLNRTSSHRLAMLRNMTIVRELGITQEIRAHDYPQCRRQPLGCQKMVSATTAGQIEPDLQTAGSASGSAASRTI